MRIHIISGGADKTSYEEPWNWIRGKQKYHTMQHDKDWDYIKAHFPHLAYKIDRARELWHEKSEQATGR